MGHQKRMLAGCVRGTTPSLGTARPSPTTTAVTTTAAAAVPGGGGAGAGGRCRRRPLAVALRVRVAGSAGYTVGAASFRLSQRTVMTAVAVTTAATVRQLRPGGGGLAPASVLGDGKEGIDDLGCSGDGRSGRGGLDGSGDGGGSVGVGGRGGGETLASFPPTGPPVRARRGAGSHLRPCKKRGRRRARLLYVGATRNNGRSSNEALDLMDRTEGAEGGARGNGPAPENRACGFELGGAGGGGVAVSATWLYRRSVWVAARRRALPSLSLPTQAPSHSLSPWPPPLPSPTPPADLATASVLLVAAVSAWAPGGWGRESCGGAQEGWWGGKNQRRLVRGDAQAALAPSHRPIRARRRRPAAPPPGTVGEDGGPARPTC